VPSIVIVARLGWVTIAANLFVDSSESLKELANAFAKQVAHTGKCGAKNLEGEKSRSRIDVSVSRLGKRVEDEENHGYDEAMVQNLVNGRSGHQGLQFSLIS
jgi:hypothetical protein